MTYRMSALPPKADICSAQGHVRFGPIADISHVWPLSLVALDRAATTVMASKLGNPTSFRVGLRPVLRMEESRGLVHRAAKPACRTGHNEHKQGKPPKPAFFGSSSPRLRPFGSRFQRLRGGADRHGPLFLGGPRFRPSFPALRPPINQ